MFLELARQFQTTWKFCVPAGVGDSSYLYAQTSFEVTGSLFLLEKTFFFGDQYFQSELFSKYNVEGSFFGHRLLRHRIDSCHTHFVSHNPSASQKISCREPQIAHPWSNLKEFLWVRAYAKFRKPYCIQRKTKEVKIFWFSSVFSAVTC